MLVADDLPHAERDRRGVEVGRVAAAVEARDARHHDHVAAARQQRRHGIEPHLLDLVVDRKVLCDVGVRGRELGFGLVVVVVGDEILDGVLRKEVLEFAVELGCEGLVVAQHQCRPVQLGDDVGHRECLARPRDTQQRVVLRSVADRADQLRDRLRLVAHRGVVRYEFEIHRDKVNHKTRIALNIVPILCSGDGIRTAGPCMSENIRYLCLTARCGRRHIGFAKVFR